MNVAEFRRHVVEVLVVLVALLFAAMIGTTWCLALSITAAYPFAVGICMTLIILIAACALVTMMTAP